MLKNILTGEDETSYKRYVVLQKNIVNIMDGKCEQLVSFKTNRNEKVTFCEIIVT